MANNTQNAQPNDKSNDTLNAAQNEDFDPTQDPIFVEEQAHLTEIYATLTELNSNLNSKLKSKHSEATKALRELSDEIRPDTGGEYDEIMENLAAIETLNAVIDSYNLEHDMDVETLRRVILLLRQPYFAKVRLKLMPDRPALDVYIGAAGITDDDYNPLVVDWRNPIAETYYNQENGKTSYTVNGKTKNVELELRRQFDIERDKLNSYFDTTVAIEDPLLLGALKRHHSEKLTDITATIQREQNEVVRHTDVPALLVNGIAGSGKTSVMLQRIAYLFYQERETLRPDLVYLFGPNNVFSHYIDAVLPSMGETNPHLFTWRSFCESLGIYDRDLGVDTDIENLKRLEDNLKSYKLAKDDFDSIKFDGAYLEHEIKIEVPLARAQRTADEFGLGPRFNSLVSDMLETKLENQLRSNVSKERVEDFYNDLPTDLQEMYFNVEVDDRTKEEHISFSWAGLRHYFSQAFGKIENFEWLRLDRIAMHILGTSSVSASELIYLKLLLGERGNFDARFVMIDEVQDYTLTQLAVMARYFRKAHFLMLGDEHQAIKEGTATFPEIKALFEKSRGSVDECRLLTSYRSSPEITQLFASMVDMGDAEVKLASVRREGVTPVIEALPDKDNFLERLRGLVAEAAQNTDALCALVAADDGAVSWLAKQLGRSVQVIKNNQELPATGVVLLSLRLAKGLEFDEVIIPDASAETYPDTPLARRRLYTAISRAMHKVSALAQGELSPLLV